jgi:hypothetical protein
VAVIHSFIHSFILDSTLALIYGAVYHGTTFSWCNNKKDGSGTFVCMWNPSFLPFIFIWTSISTASSVRDDDGVWVHLGTYVVCRFAWRGIACECYRAVSATNVTCKSLGGSSLQSSSGVDWDRYGGRTLPQPFTLKIMIMDKYDGFLKS